MDELRKIEADAREAEDAWAREAQTTEIIDLRTWCRVRDAEGYRPAANGQAAEIDKPIAEAEHCPRCGRHCTYVAYRKRASYRAVAACWPCNRGQEF